MLSETEITARLAEMVKLNRRCLELTREALAESTLPDESRLVDIINKRNDYISRLRDLEKGFEQEAPDGRFSLSGQTGATTPGIDQKISELREIITELIEADRQLKARMESEKAAAGSELKRIRQGHSVLKAYAPYRTGIPSIIDREG